MTEDVRPQPKAPPVRQSGGSGIGTFLAVVLLLAAVVGGAWFVNQDSTNQASVPASQTSSTGASSGESGTSSSTTAPAPGAGGQAVPDKTPESEPRQQP